MSSIRVVTLAISASSLLSFAGSADACFTPSVPTPPPVTPVMPDPITVNFYFGLSTVFATTTTHSCSCGLGTSALPAGVSVNPTTGVGTIDTATGLFTPISQFGALAVNPGAGAAWMAGPSMPTGRGAPVAGLNWIGFGGAIAPVAPPPIGGNVIFAVCFSFTIPVGLGPIPIDVQIGGGVGDQGFNPLFFDPLADPTHLATYSPGFSITIPTPGSASLVALAGALASRRRR